MVSIYSKLSQNHKISRLFKWFNIQLSDFASISILLLATVVFFAFKILYFVTYTIDVALLNLLMFVAFVLAFIFRLTHYQLFGPSYSIVFRGILLTLTFYIIASYPSFTTEIYPAFSSEINLLGLTRWLVIGCAAIAWFHPSFLLPVCLFVPIQKDISASILQIGNITRTDYLPVIEVGAFLVIAAILYQELMLKGKLYFSNANKKSETKEYGIAILVCCVAVHFGNYFYSAIEKLLLDGGPLEWALTNHTQFLILIAKEAGYSPIGHLPILTNYIYDSFEQTFIFINVIVLVSQCISIFSITRVNWIIWTTLFYDLSHLLIFLVTGIFFWKWILLNLIIVIAFSKIREYCFPAWLKLLSILFLIFGGTVFFVARLGWYDTPAYVHHSFVALTKQQEKIPVPTNFFLAGSVKVAQERLGTFTTDHYPVGTWGSTRNIMQKRAAESSCNFSNNYYRPHYSGNMDLLKKFIRSHHNFIVSHTDEMGRYNYDLYPHHIFSNPLIYKKFKKLDKNQIEKYIYVVESICIGRTGARVNQRHEYEIPLEK